MPERSGSLPLVAGVGDGVGTRVVVLADTGTCEQRALKMMVFKSLVMKQKKWVRDDHELN